MARVGVELRVLRGSPSADRSVGGGRTVPKSLIVVDDDPDIRLLVRAMVGGDARITLVGEALSAAEAVKLARSVAPNLILLDHCLEGEWTGLAAAPALKRAAPSTKILLFTAYDMASAVERQPAIDDYLRKDQVMELVAAIERLLGLDSVA
jgi:CheY-like chemotaxis protein